jgi:hypothetical protein
MELLLAIACDLDSTGEAADARWVALVIRHLRSRYRALRAGILKVLRCCLPRFSVRASLIHVCCRTPDVNHSISGESGDCHHEEKRNSCEYLVHVAVNLHNRL